MSMRTEKVASLIREEIGVLLERQYQSQEYGLMTVTEVHMSPDLQLAKVYISVFGDEELRMRTMKMLDENKSHIRAYLGSNLRLKFTPAIQFYIDETLDRVDRINKLIDQIHKEAKNSKE